MGRFMAIAFLIVVFCCGCNSKSSETKSLQPFDLSDLGTLPIGLEVVHTPDSVLAQKGGGSGYDYTWTFQTTVRSTGAPVTIQEFGALMDDNGRWVLGNFTKKFFTQNDFAEWYSCPGGLVTEGNEFSDPSNWGGADCLRPGKTKWFFVGIDDNGNRVKGEAVVEQIAELIE